MKAESVLKALLVRMCALIVIGAAWVTPVAGQAQEKKPEPPKISGDEQKALDKVRTATDAAGKLKASGDYLKKYGRSSMRANLVEHVALAVEKTSDPAQRDALAKQFISTFNQPDEAWYVIYIIVNNALTQNKVDEAFQEGAKYLEKNPDDARIYADLAIAGAQPQNQKFIPQAKEYSLKAIELMESDKKNEKMEAEYWKNFRNSYLPKMYQVQGLIAYYSKDIAAAKTRLESAAGLDQSDPVTFAVLGQIYDEEYQAAAKEYNSAPPKFRDELYKKAAEKLDLVIENFARAMAAADGKPQYQQLQQQLLPVLETYYTFKNNGKKDGLQEYIQKFRKPTAP